ncbi:hypothetical protein D3C86_1934600 [compost metagenome]
MLGVQRLDRVTLRRGQLEHQCADGFVRNGCRGFFFHFLDFGFFNLRFFFLLESFLHLGWVNILNLHLDFRRTRRTAGQGEGKQIDGFGVREQRFGMGLDQGFDRHVASSFLVKVCRRW